MRELREEICVKVKQEWLEKLGELDIFFPKKSGWNQKVHVFTAKKWLGVPKETEEMRPVWVNARNPPFEKMWKDDPYWFPLLLAGKRFKGAFVFGSDNESIEKHSVEEI